MFANLDSRSWLLAITLCVIFALLQLAAPLWKAHPSISTTEIQSTQYDELVVRVESLEAEISKLIESVYAASSEQLSGTSSTTDQDELTRISKEVFSLKEIIVESPEKALSIPLLRKEIDELKSQHEALVDSMNSQIDRFYDNSQWFFGVMALLIALGAILRGQK